jgi:formylglycine-generating enzyme required for sulfatase activity
MVTPFRMTKNPISVRRYKQCVSAEACDAPALASAECQTAGDPKHLNGPTFEAADGDDLPVTCVKPEQAIAYCRWLGGKLPDSTQWLAGARGPAVRRYSWGNELNACEQHPEARLRGRTCDVSTRERLRIGAHAAGASPSGIEDVLVTPAELVATSHDAFFSVCGDGADACLARGLSPGAIDGFGPIPSAPTEPAETGPPSIQTFGFRCALEDK